MRKNIYEEFSEKVAIAICDKNPEYSWTILGHGSLVYSEKQSTQHNINTIVAPIIEGKVKLNKTTLVPMPVGAVEVLRLRQTWSRGVLASKNERSKGVRDRKVFLSTAEFECVELGLLWNIDGTVSEALNQLARTKYLVFSAKCRGRSIRLNVPCSEIFRFYYSPTTNFALAALSGDCAEKCLYNPRNRDASALEAARKGIPCITLRKSIEDVTAPYVARVATCSYAEASFNNIFADIFHSPQKNPNMVFSCVPPLAQETSWDVDGVEVGDDFFVCQIKSCYGEFPFNRVLFDRDNNTGGRRTRPPDEEILLEQADPQFLENGETGGTTTLADAVSPTISVASVVVEGEFEKPMFPGLRGVPVEKVLKAVIEDETTRTITVLSGEALIEYVTTAAASGEIGNQNIGQIKIQQSGIIDEDTPNHEKIVSIYEILIALDKHLKSSKLGRAQLLIYRKQRHPKSKIASVVPYYNYNDELLCFTDKKNIDKYFESGQDSYFLRPMAFVVIKYQNIIYYMIEFLASDGISYDGKSTLFFSELSAKFNEELVESEIKKFDLFGRSWSKETIGAKPLPSSKLAHKFKHNYRSDVERKVDLILKKLEKK